LTNRGRPHRPSSKYDSPLGLCTTHISGPGKLSHKDKPAMTNPNREVAYISSAVGGSLSQISFEDGGNRSRVAAIHGGGIRGKIRGFSRASRRSLLRRMASINRTAFRAFKGRLLFTTLTYPTDYPGDPAVCKRHLEAFGKRLERGSTGPSLRSGGWASRGVEPGTFTFCCLFLRPSVR
jgi:hypothetical protein